MRSERRALVTGYWYRARGTPHIRLAGITGDFGQLYDGALFAATTVWWNEYLRRRPGWVEFGSFRPIDDELLQRLRKAPNRRNEQFLRELGESHGVTAPRLGVAALVLAYALARTLMAGSPYEGAADLGVRHGAAITPDDFETLGKRYTIVADDYLWGEQSPGWWAEQERDWLPSRLAIAAMRWTYRDQVRRFERSLGGSLGEGFGWAEGEATQGLVKFRDRLFELGGRVLEAELHR